jgi:hypothetical protein
MGEGKELSEVESTPLETKPPSPASTKGLADTSEKAQPQSADRHNYTSTTLFSEPYSLGDQAGQFGSMLQLPSIKNLYS